MISEDRAGKSLNYLASTDEDTAEAKVSVAKCEYRCKLIRAQVMLEQTEGSIAVKEAKAESDERTQKAEAERFMAIGIFEHLKAKRATAEWVIETWRSLNANRRQGNP